MKLKKINLKKNIIYNYIMYILITFISSGVFFGSALFYFYNTYNLKFFNTYNLKFLNTTDTSNTLIHKSIINAINNNQNYSNKLDKNCQTDNNLENTYLNKSTQIDNNSFLYELEEIIEKTPDKYKWFYL